MSCPLQPTSTYYSSWCSQNGASLDPSAIYSIFTTLAAAFGFQADNASNTFEYLMSVLDSRASRMSCPMALLSVHADVIGGDSSNYKQWYFAAYYDEDQGNSDEREIDAKWSHLDRYLRGKSPQGEADDATSLFAMDSKWRQKIGEFSERECVVQLALYFLVWGEANNVRFMPECVCFVFKCALDWYLGKEHDVSDDPSQDHNAPPAPYDFLDNTISPLYNFLRDQQLDSVNGS